MLNVWIICLWKKIRKAQINIMQVILMIVTKNYYKKDLSY